METDKLTTPCEGEIRRILNLMVEEILSPEIHQEPDETNINHINTGAVNSSEEVKDIDTNLIANSTTNAETNILKTDAVNSNEEVRVIDIGTIHVCKDGDHPEKGEIETQPDLESISNDEEKSLLISVESSLNSSEEKQMFTKALDLVCSNDIPNSLNTPCLNVSSLKILAAKKNSENNYISSGHLNKEKEPDTVHFNSPLAVVYEYTVSQSSCSGSTQSLSDDDSLDLYDVKEHLKLDKYPCTETIKETTGTIKELVNLFVNSEKEELSGACGDQGETLVSDHIKFMPNEEKEEQELMDIGQSQTKVRDSNALGLKTGCDIVGIVTETVMSDCAIDKMSSKTENSVEVNYESFETQVKMVSSETSRSDTETPVTVHADNQSHVNHKETNLDQNAGKAEDNTGKFSENSLNSTGESFNALKHGSNSDLINLSTTEDIGKIVNEIHMYNQDLITLDEKQPEHKKHVNDQENGETDVGDSTKAEVNAINPVVKNMHEKMNNSVEVNNKKFEIHQEMDKTETTMCGLEYQANEKDVVGEKCPANEKDVVGEKCPIKTVLDKKLSPVKTDDKNENFYENIMTPGGDSFNTFLTLLGRNTDVKVQFTNQEDNGIENEATTLVSVNESHTHTQVTPNEEPEVIPLESEESEIIFSKEGDFKRNVQDYVNENISANLTDKHMVQSFNENIDLSEQSSCNSKTLHVPVERNLAFSPIIPVKEIFHKASMCSSFDRSPDLFLESESVDSTDHSNLGKETIEATKSAEEEDVTMESIANESSDINTDSLAIQKDVSDVHMKDIIEKDIDHEADIADENDALGKGHTNTNEFNEKTSIVSEEFPADGVNCDNKDKVKEDIYPENNVEICLNSRKRKLFHTRQEVNHSAAKVIKCEEIIQACGTSLKEQEDIALVEQPSKLKVLANKALDKEEENILWNKSCPEQVINSNLSNKIYPSGKDHILQELEPNTLVMEQGSPPSNAILTVETSTQKDDIKPSSDSDLEVSEHCLDNQIDKNIINEKSSTFENDKNNISRKKIENVEYVGFISATEHLSQKSQGSSTGFVFDGHAQESGVVFSSQSSDRSITFVNDLQTIANETESVENKTYYELAVDMDTTINNLNGETVNSKQEKVGETMETDKDTEMELDLSDLDSYIDKSIDQIVPGEDTDQADDVHPDTICSKEGEAKLYACDMDIYDDTDRPVCNNIEKTGPKVGTKAGCFKWRYAPSCDLDNTAPPDLDLEDQVVKIIPLKTCGKPIRIGLSKRQSIGHLHKLKEH